MMLTLFVNCSPFRRGYDPSRSSVILYSVLLYYCTQRLILYCMVSDDVFTIPCVDMVTI